MRFVISHLLLLCFCTLLAEAQPAGVAQYDGIRLSGIVQSDNLFPTGTQADGSNEDWRSNTYLDLKLTSRYADAGVRLEYLEHPLPGFERDFRGWGLPHYYLNGHSSLADGQSSMDFTVGTFYEQFGSGFILRTYEERTLGIDNSLLGGRIVFRPYKGIALKAVSGSQRHYWQQSDSWVTGADAEFSIDQWSEHMQRSGTTLTVGASWVVKHENAEADNILVDTVHKLHLPSNVHAFDLRAAFQHGGFSLLGEFAHKQQDPSFDNDYIYHNGHVEMLSASYARRGLSVLVQAKRSEDFQFRSCRSMSGTSSMINHLPAFTEEHTYALAAIYPYATNAQGEWAYQAQLRRNLRSRSLLGGRYGTNVKLGFSHVHSIAREPMPLSLPSGIVLNGRGSDGYSSSFFKWGDETYYQDINLQLERKFSKTTKLSIMYMNQLYNKTAIEGEGGIIHSNIFVADALFNLSRQTRLRCEAQYLQTHDDDGDWLFGLAELSLAPHWMLTASDTWNSGRTDAHYYMLSATYNISSHRIALGWGRTRAGFNCSGGVCRYIPQTRGFTFNYNYNF